MAKSTFLQDFKAFAMKGNVVDMAVGVIIGGAFGKIVTSVVNDIIMPPIGWLIGGVNFKDLTKLTTKKKEDTKPATPPAPPAPSAEEKLLTEIRDLLKNKQ